MKVGGYFTVEATFVVTICIWVIVALCFDGLYIHDCVVLESSVNQSVQAILSEDGDCSETKIEELLKERMEKKLFLMKVYNFEASKGLQTVEIKLEYKLPISLNLIQKIFSKKGTVFNITRENICPAKVKWDYDIFVAKE